jgi:hypothetical protein
MSYGKIQDRTGKMSRKGAIGYMRRGISVGTRKTRYEQYELWMSRIAHTHMVKLDMREYVRDLYFVFDT